MHTTLGARILSGGQFPLLQLDETIALTHHERWDGTGYMGLRGEDIPMAGRIVSVADVFDALTSERPYKKPWSQQEAIEEIQRQSGRQFDPRVVEALVKIIHSSWDLSLEASPLAKRTLETAESTA
jgi:putative two-component system response regulator